MRLRRTLIVDALPYGDGVLFLALNNGSSFYSLRFPLRSPHSDLAIRNSAFETDALLPRLRCCCCTPFSPGLIMPFLFIWILNKKKMVTVATGQSKQWRLRLRNYKHHGSFCAKSSICHVHLHDLSHATAIVFMITGLALIFYEPPWRSSSCHLHGPP